MFSICVQVSQLTCAPTPAVRPSLSACSTTGRSCRVTPRTPRPNLSRSSVTRANARAWKRASRHSTTTWTSYKRLKDTSTPVAQPRRFILIRVSFLPSCTRFLPSEYMRGTGWYRAQTYDTLLTCKQESQVDYVNLKENKNGKLLVWCFIAGRSRCWFHVSAGFSAAIWPFLVSIKQFHGFCFFLKRSNM